MTAQVLLDVKCGGFNVSFRGHPRDLPPGREAAESSIECSSSSHIRTLRADGVVGEVVGAVRVVTRPLFYEESAYDIYVDAPGEIGHRLRLEAEEPGALEERYRSPSHVHYRWRTTANVGVLRFTAHSSVLAAPLALTVEIFPVKLDYRTDYKEMKSEIESLARGLSLALFARTRQPVSAGAAPTTILAEWWPLFEQLCAQFFNLGDRIAAHPRHTLLRRLEGVPADRAKSVDRTWARGAAFRSRRLIPAGASNLSVTLPDGSRVTPAIMMQSQSRITYDVPENRIALRCLVDVAGRLAELLRVLEQPVEEEEVEVSVTRRAYIAKVRGYSRRVSAILSAPCWQGVEASASLAAPPLSALQDPNYGKLFKIAVLLRKGLHEGTEYCAGREKQTWLLYEYWCFIKIVAIISRYLPLERLDAIRVVSTGATLSLAKGHESVVGFRCPDGSRLQVIYNKRFQELPTLAQKPDNVIELVLERPSEKPKNMCVLDAKYRLAYDKEYLDKLGSPGPEPGDVNIMHRYRDAIALAIKTGDGGVEYHRPVESAVVLFPWADEDRYAYHRFFRSISTVGIGGLPFLPRTTKMVQSFIEALLGRFGLLESAQERLSAQGNENAGSPPVLGG